MVCGEGMKSGAGGAGGASWRRCGLELAPGGQLPKFLQIGLQNHLSGSLWQPCSLVSWEAWHGGHLGEEYPMLPQFPHLGQSTPRSPGIPLEREQRGVGEEASLNSGMSLSLPWRALGQVVSPPAPRFPPLSNEGNSDTYLIELF